LGSRRRDWTKTANFSHDRHDISIDSARFTVKIWQWARQILTKHATRRCSAVGNLILAAELDYPTDANLP
jgi:hypothetical protein